MVVFLDRSLFIRRPVLDMTVFDLSGWYFRNYLHSSFRKNRLSDTWIRGFLRRPVFCSNKTEVAREDKRLRDYLLSKPMPVVILDLGMLLHSSCRLYPSLKTILCTSSRRIF